MSLLSRVNLPSWLSSFLRNPLENNPLYKNTISRNIFLAIGAAYILSKTLCLTKSLFSLFQRQRPYDLVSRYGKQTWALITGSSDGIGKEFALELARRGFNIVLVARNKEKLEAVEKEIQTACPKIETRIVVADFSKAYEEGFAEGIYEQVQDLDISILVNNAGTAITKRYENIPINTVREIVTVNCLSQALLTRVLLPKLAARLTKSAIINLSSLTALYPLPSVQLYAGTKVFNDYLSRGLSYEYDNIDILSLKPGVITTKLMAYRKPDHETILPIEFVRTALDSLGHTDHTVGHWKHRKIAWIMGAVPETIREALIKRRYVRTKKTKVQQPETTQ